MEGKGEREGKQEVGRARVSQGMDLWACMNRWVSGWMLACSLAGGLAGGLAG